MLRIVAGKLRGRRIRTPRGSRTRPTSDRMKETVFNVLGDAVVGGRVLDLFAGSGNLGLEAGSRGARHVVCVERSRAALRVLQGNVHDLGLEALVEVVRADAVAFVARWRGPAWDVVLVDPPYGRGWEARLLRAWPAAALRPGGWWVLQHGRDTEVARDATAAAGLQPVTTRRFGDTQIDFFRRGTAPGAEDALPENA